jgi:hypothetical protein
MYVRSLLLENFKCFGSASLDLQYPGRKGDNVPEFDNVNLILGDNGGGKSSVLRALAIAMLAPALPGAGFIATRLVRRVKPGVPIVTHADLVADGWRPPGETIPGAGRRQAYKLTARIRMSQNGPDKLVPSDTKDDKSLAGVLEDDVSNAVFIAGYGATRFVEPGNFSAASAFKSRSLRYQRVAGLFEDNVTLRPMQSWLPQLQLRSADAHDRAITLINSVLPANIRFSGEHDDREEQFVFEFNGLRTPFGSLSDGYKAFVGWIGDFVGHLAEVAKPRQAFTDIPGVVLVDEIDLHLHPEWQRTVVPTLAKAFPNVQFVLTSHSPLIAGSLRKENVFVTGSKEDGTASIEQFQESVYGRSTEQLLLSSYFGLTNTRPDAFQDESRVLFRQAAQGDPDAALDYLKKLSGTVSETRK